MRQEPAFFGDDELTLIYMARRLPDALKVENILTDAGVEYLVETNTYVGGLIMRRELTGAFFYVTEDAVRKSEDVLKANRYKPYHPD